jgi:ribosomal RNA-processing protein 17
MEAPLLAFTESVQRQNAKKEKDKGKSSKSSSKLKGRKKGGKASAAAAGPYTYKRNKKGSSTPTIQFDDAARTEYLSGFRKRKNARKEAARKFLEEQKKEELKANRRETREARKEKARENVQAERDLFGEAYEGGLGDTDGVGAEGDDTEAEPAEEAYDSDQHFTTVVVQDWDPDMDDADDNRGASTSAPAEPSSKAKGKARFDDRKGGVGGRDRGSANGRQPNRGRGPPLPSTEGISSLLTDSAASEALKEVAELQQAYAPTSKDGEGDPSKKKKTFHYESAAERALAQAKIKDQRRKHAEKRKADNVAALKVPGGKKKGTTKKSGKRGTGGIGSSKQKREKSKAAHAPRNKR